MPTAETVDLKVFQAGTREDRGQVVTDGGRVLCVCALGHNYAEARERAYDQVKAITWDACHYRKDIGYRAIERQAIQAP